MGLRVALGVRERIGERARNIVGVRLMIRTREGKAREEGREKR